MTTRQKRGHCLVTRRGSILAAFERKEMAQARKQRLVEQGHSARDLRIQGFGGWIVSDPDEGIVDVAGTQREALDAVQRLVAIDGYARKRLTVCLALEEVIRDWMNGSSWCWTTDEVRFRNKPLTVAALDKSG